MPRETPLNLDQTEKSPLRDAYLLLGAKSPVDLSVKFTEEDNIIFKSKILDYDNPEFTIYKVKNILERASDEALSPEEKESKNGILWHWNHHAISCAILRKDMEKAKHYAEEALRYQSASPDHPNKITKLFSLLLNDKLEEAEKLTNEITIDYEKKTAEDIIKVYKNRWESV